MIRSIRRLSAVIAVLLFAAVVFVLLSRAGVIGGRLELEFLERVGRAAGVVTLVAAVLLVTL